MTVNQIYNVKFCVVQCFLVRQL